MSKCLFVFGLVGSLGVAATTARAAVSMTVACHMANIVIADAQSVHNSGASSDLGAAAKRLVPQIEQYLSSQDDSFHDRQAEGITMFMMGGLWDHMLAHPGDAEAQEIRRIFDCQAD